MSYSSHIGALSGAIAGGAVGTIFGPVATIWGASLGAVIGDELDRRTSKDTVKPTPESAGGDDIERVVVEVTTDVGEIYGVDQREYSLEEGDIVALPKINAEALLEKAAARELGEALRSTDDTEKNETSATSDNSVETANSIKEDTGSDITSKTTVLEVLRTVQNKERQSEQLQELPDNFYDDVRDSIGELNDEKESLVQEATKLVNSADVSTEYDLHQVSSQLDQLENQIRELVDKIETQKEITNALYERRVGKITKQASFEESGLETDPEEHMTDEERELFHKLTEQISDNREMTKSDLDKRNPLEQSVESDTKDSYSISETPSPDENDSAEEGKKEQ